MSLQKMEQTKQMLSKEASEGISSKNLDKLITEEAYSQISATAPGLIPMIVGVNIDEKTSDESSKIGGASLIIDGTKYVIPIIYNGKETFAGMFIYNEDTDVMLSLTKKLAKRIVGSGQTLSGSAQDKKVAFDKGNVKKLFTPPSTFAPKVASSSIVYTAAENDIVKVAMAKSINESTMLKNMFVNTYGIDFVESLERSLIEKTASETLLDKSEAEVISSFEALEKSEWIFKEAAARELAQYGVSISVGEDRPTKKLVSIESPSSIITSKLGVEAIEEITTAGIYKTLNKNGMVPEYAVYDGSRVLYSEHGRTERKGAVGAEAELDEVPFLRLLNRDSARGASKILILSGGKVKEILNINDASFTMGSIVFNTTRKGTSKIVIKVDSNDDIVTSMGVSYIGDKNVRILNTDFTKSFDPVTLSDVDNGSFAKDFYESSNIVKIQKDPSGDFILGGKMLSYENAARKLIGDGYDKLSVLTLLKTSKEKGSAAFAEIGYQLESISSMIQNLSGRVGTIENALQQVQQPQGADAQQQPQQQPQQQGDGLANVPQQQSEQQQPQIGGFIDNASGFAQDGAQAQQDPMAQQQQEEMARQQQLQEEQDFKAKVLSEGINPDMDPAILSSVMELKDSQVMDVSALTMIAQGSNIGAALQDLSPDFQNGVSALNKILFNFMARESEAVSIIGDKQYKKTILDLKSMAIKSTDMLIDIQQHSDNQE